MTSRGEALLEWYADARRDLPWRRTTDPYLILVSEVMLQQTQTDRVVPFYERFTARFPDAGSLANADLTEVLSLWQGLGYPSRARRLREAARIVTESGWPEDLEALPGVGPYTAAAVGSFAFGQEVAAVDTNVRRVVSRWIGTPLDGADLRVAADDAVTGPAATWNQAMMELGALVCRPRTPHCGQCPVEEWCEDPAAYVSPPRQAPYEGSDRQERGRILAVLLDGPLEMTALVDASPIPDRAEAIVAALAGERLVEIEGTTVRLAD